MSEQNSFEQVNNWKHVIDNFLLKYCLRIRFITRITDIHSWELVFIKLPCLLWNKMKYLIENVHNFWLFMTMKIEVKIVKCKVMGSCFLKDYIIWKSMKKSYNLLKSWNRQNLTWIWFVFLLNTSQQRQKYCLLRITRQFTTSKCLFYISWYLLTTDNNLEGYISGRKSIMLQLDM